MITNKQLAQVLRNAIPYLNLTSGTGNRFGSSFICHAIGYSETSGEFVDPISPAAHKVISIINKRLMVGYNESTMCGWLKSKGVPYEDMPFEKIQAHRLAWMNMLINEFESE